MGLLAGIFAVNKSQGRQITHPSENTAHGALINHITNTEYKNFQPSNINFGLFPPLSVNIKDKQLKKEAVVKRAIKDWEEFCETTY
jgi:methylenetetrahydrofolate--tRNA-(uracil-5-)-methyltransferase